MNKYLEIGTVVGYSDMANPWQTAIVTTLPGNGGWQECVFEDGHTSQVILRSVEGIGGWKFSSDPKATDEQVEDARRRGAETKKARREDQERRLQEYQDAETAFKAATPEWAKGVVVAEMEEDQSDWNTDYHGSTTVRTVVLGFSKHSRQLFPEMKKMARLSDIPEVQALADAPKTAEHRENYSMGGGTYLKDGSRYSTGWSIRKSSLSGAGFSHMDIDSLNKAAKRAA